AAWRRLSEVYGPLVYAWCRRASLAEQDAADVVQEVFRSVAENLEKFSHRGPGSFRAWLRAVTLNKVTDHRRRAQGQPVAVGGSDDVLAAVAVGESDAEAEASERALLVRIVLQRLTPEFSAQAWKAFWRLTMTNRTSAE